ncbi:hypothetical protein ACXZ66_05530 [Corynebacterium sp. S7]
MEVLIPEDCGNAPRVNIVGRFVANWAEGNTEAMSKWLSTDVVWNPVPAEELVGVDAVLSQIPAEQPERVDVNTIITHGRLASCDGTLTFKDSVQHFSLVFRFTSASKKAQIKTVRAFLVAGAE